MSPKRNLCATLAFVVVFCIAGLVSTLLLNLSSQQQQQQQAQDPSHQISHIVPPPHNTQNIYRGYGSDYAFDLNDTSSSPSSRKSWMSSLPDSVPLSSITLPGTHDTFTHKIEDIVFQCQNHPLSVQLDSGIRYIDLRARLFDDDLGIYHTNVFTGYSYAEALLILFAFLRENPSEALIVRIKDEGRPLGVRPAPRTFEEVFNNYRTQNSTTAPGCKEHFWVPPANMTAWPTLGEIRGKMILLTEFKIAVDQSHEPAGREADGERKEERDGKGEEDRNEAKAPPQPAYGIPWRTSMIELEDLWIIARLDDKWDAIQRNLVNATRNKHRDDLLFLTHLSATGGVTPIHAAAGTRNGSEAGMDERTGKWLLEHESGDNDKSGGGGVIIADLPGRKLVDAALSRNEWLKKRTT